MLMKDKNKEEGTGRGRFGWLSDCVAGWLYAELGDTHFIFCTLCFCSVVRRG